MFAPSEARDTGEADSTPWSRPALVDNDPIVLIPGTHTDAEGVTHEVGTDDFARAVLEAIPAGTLYRMERQVGRLEGPAGSNEFRSITETSMRLVVDEHVRLARWVKRKGSLPALLYQPCTKDLAALVVEAASSHVGTRALKLLVPYPVYLPGMERAKPGWNDCGVYYDEPPELHGLQPNATGALDVLDDLVVDFPLSDESSRQNLYAAMLTLVCRPAIEGPVPFFLAMAPLERTGKGKLIDTALGVAVRGSTIPPMQIGRDESESEKRITGQILSGASVLHLDNVPIGELLDSPSLASLATAWPLWSGRKLGKSEIVRLPNRILVVLSANNPKATGELVKRTVPITLDPQDDHPELRESFEHPDCLAYAAERRPLVLAALLGLVEAWRTAGSPASKIRMGGFERWARIVLGALVHGGASRVMGNYRLWCARADEQNADIESLVSKWSVVHATAPISATQVLDIATDLGIFHDVLSKSTPHGRLMALARKVLTPLTDRPVGTWRIRRETSGSNSAFRLEHNKP